MTGHAIGEPPRPASAPPPSRPAPPRFCMPRRLLCRAPHRPASPVGCPDVGFDQ